MSYDVIIAVLDAERDAYIAALNASCKLRF